MKLVNKVFSTTDYNIFKLIRENRDLKDNIKLREEIAENGILVPVIVNEKYEVIDGQHRIMIAGSLQKEVPFIVIEGAGKKEIISINTTAKQWSLYDYIKSYADEGIENYVKLIELIDRYEVNIGVLCSLSFNTTDGYRPQSKVRDKKLEFVNYDFLVEFLDFYSKLISETILENSKGLVTSLYVLYRLEKFDEDRIFDKSGVISERLKGVTKQSTTTQILIEEYNKRIRNEENQIHFFPNSRDSAVFFEKTKKEVRGLDGTSTEIYKLDREGTD